MTKKTGQSKKAAERVRIKVRQEEKRLGLAPGTAPASIRDQIKAQVEAEVATKVELNELLGIAPAAAAGPASDARNKVRGLQDNGDARGAATTLVQLAQQGHLPDQKLLEDVIRMCLEVGDVRAAGLVVLWMQQMGQSVSVRFAMQCISGISQLAEQEASLVVCRALVSLCHFSFIPGDGDKTMMPRPATQMEAAQRTAYIFHFVPLMVAEFRAEVDEMSRGTGRGGLSSVLNDIRVTALPQGGALQCHLGLGQILPYKKGDCVLMKFGQSIEVEGEVTDDMPQSFKVRVAGAPSSRPVNIPPGASCTVVRIGYRSQWNRQLEAMRQLLEIRPPGMPLSKSLRPRIADSALCDTILAAPVHGLGGMYYSQNIEGLCASPPGGGRAISFEQAMMHAAGEQSLNLSQCEAVAGALSRRITLIQGPPGTGKTHTAVRLVACLARSGAGPILACSDSNTAVDNLVEGFASIGLDVCRLGLPEAIRPDLTKYSLDAHENNMGSPGGKGKGKRGYGGVQYEELYNRLKVAQVICATCSGAGVKLLERIAFPVVLVDEAAQTTEPSVLVPLCHGATRLCLVGDHKQLPATVLSREAELHGLAISLFDRLQNAGAKLHMLKTQFRMHPGLSTYWSAAFYNSEVGAGVASADRPPPAGIQWPVQGVGLLFVPCEGQEQQQGMSQANMQEVQTVVQVVHLLLAGNDVQPQGIGIITPYAAQVRVLREMLRDTAPGIEINSVDGFQGREKDVIVVSTVRASEAGTTGFLSDARRMNVTVTRAKRGLVVCGHVQTLHRDKSWGPWLRWASMVGVVQGAVPADPMAAAKFALAAVEGEGSSVQREVMALAGSESTSLMPQALPGVLQLPALETMELPVPGFPGF
eukprot:TRINITY_DN89514_c0_g1_i1.p1 TRINITY_DN89514_c0_g1~~TRINITY_DN89514_c0_g1_i1.p1  ORF type:complete len:883 (+),score=142.69 TRINITY_DN89514_c0_g1_i1:37-2649(+)